MSIIRRVSPKVAGWGAVGLGLLVAVVGGVLVSHAPWNILGAIVLVGASILLAVGAVWLVRRDWNEPWPPAVDDSLAKRLRTRRTLLVMYSVLLPLAVGYGVYSIAVGRWWSFAYALLLASQAALNLSVFRRLQRVADEELNERAGVQGGEHHDAVE